MISLEMFFKTTTIGWNSYLESYKVIECYIQLYNMKIKRNSIQLLKEIESLNSNFKFSLKW